MPSSSPVRLPFNEAKAAQAAARLLRLHSGTMNYMKLIKLLYLIDRKALERWGRPVSTDCYVSMDKGPVLSEVLDLITHGIGEGAAGAWHELISEPKGYAVSLLPPIPPDDELSKAEEKLIDEIYGEFGSRSPWDLVELVHQLAEWQDPHGSAIAISYADILKAVGKDTAEIAQIEAELRALHEVDRLFA